MPVSKVRAQGRIGGRVRGKIQYRKPKFKINNNINTRLSFKKNVNVHSTKCIQQIVNFFLDIFNGAKIQIVQGFTTVAVIATVCCGVYASGYRFGSEVIVDGNVVGVVMEQSEAYKAIAQVSGDLQAYTFGEASYHKDPIFTSRIVCPGRITSVDEMRDRMMSNVGYAVKVCAIYAGDEFITALVDRGVANEVLESYKERYCAGLDNSSVSFETSIQLKDQFLPAAAIKDFDRAICALENGKGSKIRVQHNVEYTGVVPFEVATIDAPDLYKGKNEVVVQGKEGMENIFACVTYLNGEEVKREILSTQRVKNPEKQIERVGTKDLPRTVATGDFSRPAYGSISSRFGSRWGRQHAGIDIAGDYGSVIKAADGGVITFVGACGGYGNLVTISHENGYETYYGHCSSFSIKCGERVAKGDVIAKMGSTGNSTGPHLHFEVRKDGIPQNPQRYVDF